MSFLASIRGKAIATLAVVVVAGSMATQFAGSSEQRWTCDGVSMTALEIAQKRGVPVDKLDRLASIRDLTAADICSMPAGKLKRAIYKIDNPNPDHPGDAAAWRALRQKDEKGNIPIDGMMRAVEHAKTMAPPASTGAFSSQQVTRNNWTWLGPGNIGGRIRSIAIDPTDANKIWAGSVGGGLWKTTNAGAWWTPVSGFLANLTVSSIVINPVTPTVMYAGTGEGFYNADGIRGAGILKSMDGGVTWFRLNATNTADFLYVNRLAISANGAGLLAATRTGLFRSTNGGSSWTKVITGEMLDVDFAPGINTSAVAGGRNGQAWRSTNGGQTWTAATGLPTQPGFGGRVELAYAPSNVLVVYASVDNSNYSTGSYGSALYRSLDGGRTYTLRNNSVNYLSSQGWYGNALWVAPDNPAVVIVGGLDLWRSANGGTTFTQISEWWSAPTSAHADHHVIVAAPGYGSANRTVYFGNDGGVYRVNNVLTVSKTKDWHELNNNLGVTQFYGVAVNPTTKSVTGGTQDNGTLQYTVAGGRQAWAASFGGDGGYSAADPTDPNYFYGEYVYLQIHRSTDGGVSSDYIYNGISDADSCANFIAPFILDPNNSNRLLGGGCRLWRSDNAKATTPTWSSIKPSTGSEISAIAVAPGDPDIVWVGHNDGSVYKTTNGTFVSPTWTQVSAGLPGRYVNRLTISATDHNIVYASLGGYSTPNVWMTTNAGSSWTARSGSGGTALPAAPVYSLVIHPTTPAWIYAGTEVGVFYSEDSGATWHNPATGPILTAIDELVFSGTDLYAATHGRGIYKAPTN